MFFIVIFLVFSFIIDIFFRYLNKWVLSVLKNIKAFLISNLKIKTIIDLNHSKNSESLLLIFYHFLLT